MMNTTSLKTPPLRNQHCTPRQFSPVRHNVYETEKSYFIEFAIPGFSKEHFTLESTRTSLKVTFAKPQVEDKEAKQVTEGFAYDSFERTFKLNPQSLDFEGINATYAQGLLRVEVPKTEAAIKTSRSIPVL